jgi:hypothetical protein
MPALKSTDYTATVTWLGIVTNNDRDELLSEVRAALDLTFAGVAGSVHGGATRSACSRVRTQYPKGTEIRNERQLSIVSEEELAEIAAQMGVAVIDPARLGASIVVRGLPDFSFVPPSSRLQAPSGATVTIDMQNRPCQFPAKSLAKVVSGTGRAFKSSAEGRRGVTASIAREGRVALGDVLRLHVPDQRMWQPGS